MNISTDENIDIHNMLWCPIDLPKFPISNIDLTANTHWTNWNFLKLSEKRNSPYDKSDYSEFLKSNYPMVIDWISKLPILSIRNIKFNIQNSEVPSHIDFTNPSENIELFKNNSTNEPCGYRVLLNGSRNNSLYVIKNGTKVYTTMPEDTDVYVLGHTNVAHGVDFEPGRKTLFLHIEVDGVKHNELLTRSYEKYKNYALMK